MICLTNIPIHPYRFADETLAGSNLYRCLRLTAEDLSEEDEASIKAWCQEVFRSSPMSPHVYSRLATMIRERCDKELGRGWNCVVGKSFGAFVTQKLKAYIYLSVYQGVSILLWKA